LIILIVVVLTVVVEVEVDVEVEVEVDVEVGVEVEVEVEVEDVIEVNFSVELAVGAEVVVDAAVEVWVTLIELDVVLEVEDWTETSEETVSAGVVNDSVDGSIRDGKDSTLEVAAATVDDSVVKESSDGVSRGVVVFSSLSWKLGEDDAGMLVVSETSAFASWFESAASSSEAVEVFAQVVEVAPLTVFTLMLLVVAGGLSEEKVVFLCLFLNGSEFKHDLLPQHWIMPRFAFIFFGPMRHNYEDK